MSFWNEQPLRAPAFVALAVILVRMFQRLLLDYILCVNTKRLASEIDRFKTLETAIGQGIIELKAMQDSMASSAVTGAELLWTLVLIFFFMLAVGIDAHDWSCIKGWCSRNMQ